MSDPDWEIDENLQQENVYLAPAEGNRAQVEETAEGRSLIRGNNSVTKTRLNWAIRLCLFGP